eukprot:1479113-Amphidinium_carterae.1
MLLNCGELYQARAMRFALACSLEHAGPHEVQELAEVEPTTLISIALRHQMSGFLKYRVSALFRTYCQTLSDGFWVE